jgi:outer membrane protein assembly factor BamB
MAAGYRWPAYRWAVGGAVAAIVLALITVTALSHADDGGSGSGLDNPSGLVVSLLWRIPTGQAATGPPAVTTDGVFLGGTDGKIRAFARADGRPMWTSTAGSGDAVYARAAHRVVYATTAGGAVVAVDAGTGETKWQRQTNTTFSAPPAIGKDRVYAGGHDSVLYAVRISGSHLYRRVETGGEIRTTPTLIGDAAIVASDDGRLYVAVAGGLRWKPRIGRPTEGPIAAGDAACTPLTDGSVRCVRATDGDVLPRIALPGTKLSAPISGDNGLLFAAGANGAVGAWDTDTGVRRWLFRPRIPAAAAGHLVRRQDRIVAAYPDGRLIGLDAATGNRMWEVTLQDHFDTAPRIDDTATYVVGRTGTLYALQTPGSSQTATPKPTPTGTPSPPPTRARPHRDPPKPTTSDPPLDSPSPDGGKTVISTPSEEPPPDFGGQ